MIKAQCQEKTGEKEVLITAIAYIMFFETQQYTSLRVTLYLLTMARGVETRKGF